MYTLGPKEKSICCYGLYTGWFDMWRIGDHAKYASNSWFRTDSAPEHLHLHKAQSLQAIGGAIKSLAYPELLLPLPLIIGFHVAPPSQEPLDYGSHKIIAFPGPSQ